MSTESVFIIQHKDSIKKSLGADDFVIDILESECRRIVGVSLTMKYPFLLHGLLALLSNIVFPIVGLKRRVKSQCDDFIFVSCPDKVFRTKTMDLLADDLNYSIIYLPNFHIASAIKYNNYFKGKRAKVFFPTIRIKHVLSARRLFKAVNLHNGFESKQDEIKFKGVLANYLIYDNMVKTIMHDTESFEGKWLLEHQMFYFIPMVTNLHKNGIPSTELQHGIFFEPNFDFIPLFCDKVLCCSERERKLYEDNGTDRSRVEVFGAPLQTIQPAKAMSNGGNKYNLLVLVTFVNEKNKDLTSSVIQYVKQNYKSVLIRLRPRSRKEDFAQLADELQGMTISKPGIPIEEDILRCDKVLSFSVDANIEVSKFHKPFVYICDEGQAGTLKELRCATIRNYQSEIKKLMEEEFYSTFNREQYNEILGETDIVVLQDKFRNYIKQ